MSFIFGNPISPQQRVQTPPVIANTPPPTSGPQAQQYPIGTFWIDTSSDVVYTLTSFANGEANWVSQISGGGTFTSLTVDPGPTSITGEFRVEANVDEAEVIRLRENGGASGTIEIASLQGTGADSISIQSTSGGIQVSTDAVGGDIVISTDGGGALSLGSTSDTGSNDLLVNLNGGISSAMLINNELGTNNAQNANPAVNVTAPAGGIALNAGKDFFIFGVDTSTVEANIGDLNLLADTGDINIEATGGTINFVAATGVDWQITGDVDLDVTGAISLDATLASNFTVTGAAQDLTLQSAGGSVNVIATEAAADAISLNASDAAGGIDVQTGTGGLDVDSTGAIALDADLASNFTVTGAIQDLTLSSVGGSVNMNASEAAADAIVVNASAGGFQVDGVLASHVTVTGAAADLTLSAVGGSVNMTASEAISDAIVISATGASAGIQIAPAATVGSIDIGNVTPTVARTTTLNGAVVNAAHVDTLNLATGGVSTNAGAQKVVNIASGSTATGVQTVNIASGSAVSGTSTVNISTGLGGGTKKIEMGNSVDSLTTIEQFGTVNINTSGTGATTIGSAAGGAVVIDSASTIDIEPATSLTMADLGTVTTINLGNITPTVNRTTTINGSVVNAAHTDTLNLSTGGVSTNASATKVVNIATGDNLLGTTTVDIATGLATTGTKRIRMGNADGLTTISELGVVSINTSGPGATTIGSTATGGAVDVKSAGVITVQSADTTGSDILITATAAGGGVVATTDSGGFNINASGAGVTTIGNVAAGGAVALNSSSSITSLAPNVNLNNSGTGATTIGSATGGAIALVSNTASATAIHFTNNAATGGMTASVGTGNFNVSGGSISLSTAAKGIVFQAGPTIVSGSGSPDTAVTAPKGSLFLRTNGSGVNDRMYVNTDGATAWTAVVTVS